MTTSFLTAERVRGYSLMIILVNAVMFALTFVTPSDKPTIFGVGFSGDFPCFYGAGEIVREGGKLYDLELQDTIFHELQPSEAPGRTLPFVYAPFFSIPFIPLSLLPLKLAFAIWTAISLSLFLAGFHLVWKSCDLPAEFKRLALVASLAFIPFSVYAIGGGQVMAFGFFFLSLAIYLEKQGKPVLSGLALSLLTYKPILLLLIVPMLLVTRRFRALTGFALGGLSLGVLSLCVVGVDGIRDYLYALNLFRRAAGATGQYFPTWIYVDLSAFLRLLTGKRLAPIHYATMLTILAVLTKTWLKLQRSQLSWVLAITFTLFINLYTPIYDTTYLVIVALLTADYLYKTKGRIDALFKALLCALFALPIFATFLAHVTGLQLITPVILVLGIYQLTLSHDAEIVISDCGRGPVEQSMLRG